MSDLIYYEFPLNERIRVLMRLEQLFQQTEHFMRGSTVWDSRAVISSLLDILAIFGRNDLKSEIIKELDRHTNALSRVADSQAIDHGVLRQTLQDLEVLSKEVYAISGKIGGGLMENELFKSISQRSAIPGGTCVFDLPAYHYWLDQPDAQRKQDLERWLRSFDTIRHATDTILWLIRYSTNHTNEVSTAGFYQQNLDKGLPYQLIRVGIPRQLPYYVEISGGKHRFTVRFLEFSTAGRSVQAENDIPFQLTCCIL
ncbi:cell division protein ZapD [Methylogaea oryzae]|uniref:Cell division protein ZapD n=1 Tax=Methylogaea oryzae TaxID=1295382 RepID=A0A8D4VT99_9GAMM|nr:cell division protein ZapD [Methylogaea oryzae]BBL72192.1 cell division protein ZapD [Methylogaea oryzae]